MCVTLKVVHVLLVVGTRYLFQYDRLQVPAQVDVATQQLGNWLKCAGSCCASGCFGHKGDGTRNRQPLT